MHIPDGFISIPLCVILYVIAIIALYFSTKWSRENLDEKYSFVEQIKKAPDGTRTHDLLITNQSLYRLSHGSITRTLKKCTTFSA